MSSLITINVPTIQFYLKPNTDGMEMKVYKDMKKISMRAYLKPGQVKLDDGKYVDAPGIFGSLNIRAAKAQKMDGEDYLYLSIDGGLQGALYKSKNPEKNYDYVGSIGAGDDMEYVIFGKKKKSEEGDLCISVWSMEKQKKEAKSTSAPASASASAPASEYDNEPDFPF
jgi:hypothetical protein